MKKLFRLLVSSSFIAVSIMATPEAVSACSCGTSTIEEAYTEASAIFSGTVRSITNKTDISLTVKMTVNEYWKGDLDPEVTVTTVSNSAMCGYGNFSVGQSYLVYAYGEHMGTSLCSRTADILSSSAQKDVATLNTIATPKQFSKDIPTETPTQQNPILPWIWNIAVLSGGITFGYLLGRRNR